jgi:putative colanic acid biosynthesis acetyltransferase WcaF
VSRNTDSAKDPYLRPSFPVRQRLRRLAWGITYGILFYPSPRTFHAWRAFLLRCFGATLGKNCHIYPKARVWAPWNLVCEDVVTVADEAIIYNPAQIVLGSHCTVSQQAYLCGATHDYDDPAFPMIFAPIRLCAYSWICARAIVQMNVNVGEGAILGMASMATKDLEPWSINVGVPARKIKTRRNICDVKDN